nr:uncharacterized protein CI109_006744 [Kwoniella shandongensis]KAA5524944.1 hypothetical protein CI109_006744 [Kwoniella shandongensis]
MHTATLPHHWVSIWSSAAAPITLIPNDAASESPHLESHRLRPVHFPDTTIRQTFRVTLGAQRIRLTVSNECGDSDLSLSAITVAKTAPKKDGVTAGSPLTFEKTLQTVKFGLKPTLVIPPGSTAISDDIALELSSLTDITVSIYLASGESGAAVTGHFDGKADTWLQQGDVTRSSRLNNPTSLHHSFYVTEIKGWLPQDYSAIACFGDSITDRGDSYLPHNEYRGWIDVLSSRLADISLRLSVLNFGISGDQVYAGGLARFDRDVLLASGVKYVIIHMGVNDIGITPPTAEAQDGLYNRLIYAYRQLITKARARSLVVIGTTIMPFLAPPSWPTPWQFAHVKRETTRQRINAWLVNEADFDHLIDFSAVVTDPDCPQRIRKEYQLCDFLHPSHEGYEAMGKAIDIEKIFEREGGCLKEIEVGTPQNGTA